MVRWYLHTARVLRTWGVVGGFLLPPLIGAAFGSAAVRDAGFPLIFVGYLVGALYAELALVRPVAAGRRAAALMPRELGDYLPRLLRVAPWVVGSASVLVAAAAIGFVEPLAGGAGDSPSSHAVAATFAAGAMVIAAGLGPVERWLLRRPQPFTDPDLVAADDAIRSQSVHSVAASGLATQLLCLAGALGISGNAELASLRRLAPWATMLMFVAAIWTCLYYGHRAWRVRRNPAGPAGPVGPVATTPPAAPVPT